MSRRDVLAIYTIYERPRDHPDGYVVRVFAVLRGGAIPTDEAYFTQSLAEARSHIPSGFTRILRAVEDHHSVVESWI